MPGVSSSFSNRPKVVIHFIRDSVCLLNAVLRSLPLTTAEALDLDTADRVTKHENCSRGMWFGHGGSQVRQLEGPLSPIILT